MTTPTPPTPAPAPEPGAPAPATGPAPVPAPVAPPTPAPAPGAPAPIEIPEGRLDALPKWAQKLITDTSGKASAAEQRAQAVLDAIATATGQKQPDDPAVLGQKLSEQQKATHTALIKAALYEHAAEHGANPAALADSLAFQAATAGLDATDTAAVVAAAKAAAEGNAALRAIPAGPASGPADLTGAGQPGQRQLTEADLATMTAEQIVEAQDKGLLAHLL
ncbi:hypothetical protein [Embleya sp. NPDC059237]|uniref:hypothetical protein n=1 Tax=Embleya sp. NPDC059237 TaxID=3346784 RepID=UPI00369337E0